MPSLSLQFLKFQRLECIKMIEYLYKPSSYKKTSFSSSFNIKMDIGLKSYFKYFDNQSNFIRYQYMEQTVQKLRLKYPALQYFKVIEGIDEESLEVLANEIHLDFKSMSGQCKRIMKVIREFANKSQIKLKSARKLYKLLHKQEDYMTQIIMNNSKIKSLEALENRSFQDLTEIQFNSNEITSIEPLKDFRVPSLEEIDLSSNQIVRLNALNSCHWLNLKFLQLSENSIMSIQGINFSSLNSLKVLNLSENYLTSIKPLRKQFRSGCLTQIKQINLSNNYIKDFNYLSQFSFQYLTYLNVVNNLCSNVHFVQKIVMINDTAQHSLSKYEIIVNNQWAKDKILVYKYRQRSRHKLSVKMELGNERIKRQTIQKNRKLILS